MEVKVEKNVPLLETPNNKQGLLNKKTELPPIKGSLMEIASGGGPSAEKMPRFIDGDSIVLNKNAGANENSEQNSNNAYQNRDDGNNAKGFPNRNNRNNRGGYQNRGGVFNQQNDYNKQQNMSSQFGGAAGGQSFNEQNQQMLRNYNQNNMNQNQNQTNRAAGRRAGNRDRYHGGNRNNLATDGGDQRAGGGNRSEEFLIAQRLREINGPTHDLPPLETAVETKFSGRNRLFIGNLSSDVTEEELHELFKPYGEIDDIFSNFEKNFTLLKMDYHANAEKAKRELDGHVRKGRALRVRLAPNATFVRVKNLTQFVSNELLYKSFEIFGSVERANIVVDDHGKHTGEGIVEFTKKSTANLCLRFCYEKCFFLTASVRPCIVEPFQFTDDNDGLPEKQLNKNLPEFHHERSIGPRFAEIDSFEHEHGTKWKQLYELHKTKQDALKREMIMEEKKLEAEMEYTRYEHETELLRQELQKRELDIEYKKTQWEMRIKHVEEIRQRDEENMRQQQNEMQARMSRQEDEMRRRQQENSNFMQARQLNSLLEKNGASYGGNNNFNFVGNNNSDGNGGANNLQDPFAFEFGGNNTEPWERRRRN